MNNYYRIFGVFVTISVIIISGCVSPDEAPAPHPTEPSPEETTTTIPPPLPTPTIAAISDTPDPVQLLSNPTWTWSTNRKIKSVDITDDGEYVGGLSTQKAIVKTPTKTLLEKIVWINANFISIENSGKYIAISDEKFVKLLNNEADELYSYTTGGAVNKMSLLDGGILIQGGEKAPHISAVDTKGNEMWVWNPGISTSRTLDFDYSANAENILVGTQDNKIYYLSNTGKYIWFKDISGKAEDVEISDDGEKLYVLTDDSKLHSFDKYGNKNWEKELGVNTIEIEISKNGEYIITKPFNADKIHSFKHNVYLLNESGDVKWEKTLSSDVGVMSISKDSEFIVISEGRDLRMFNLMGKELANYHLDSQYGTFFVSLDMTPDAGKLVVGTTNSLLVFG
jgi:hypothetical protein